MKLFLITFLSLFISTSLYAQQTSNRYKCDFNQAYSGPLMQKNVAHIMNTLKYKETLSTNTQRTLKAEVTKYGSSLSLDGESAMYENSFGKYTWQNLVNQNINQAVGQIIGKVDAIMIDSPNLKMGVTGIISTCIFSADNSCDKVSYYEYSQYYSGDFSKPQGELIEYSCQRQ